MPDAVINVGGETIYVDVSGGGGPPLPSLAGNDGKFLTAAGGALAWATGTGADAGLRTDLAAATGADLIGTSGGGTVQDALDALGAGTSFTFDGTELWDNGYWIDRTTHNEHSPMARAVFETEATSVDIDVYANAMPEAATAIQIWVDDLLHASPVLVASLGAQTITQALPAGHKKVAIVAGVQAISAGTILGVFLVGCEFNASAALQPPEAPGRVVAYGDSTSQGGGGGSSGVNIITAWPTWFRALSARSLTVEAASQRELRDDIPDASARADFVDKLAAMQPAAIWLAIGVNDYSDGTWSSATFGTNYGDLLDDLHAALPNARIYCATPLFKHSEATGGRHLENYRQQIRALIPPRSEWAQLVEGPAILSQADMADEGGLYLHPNDQGNRKYAEHVEAVLNGRTLFDQPPSFGETVDVDWTSTANVTETGNSLQKNAGSDGVADAGGTSSQTITGGPWWVRFKITETNKLRLFGVSSVSTGVDPADLLYGLAAQTAATMSFWQDGAGYGYADTASANTIVTGDEWQVRCDGTYVYYDMIRSGKLVTIRKASRPIEAADYPLYAKGIILGSSGTITDAKAHGLIA
jgi:lysophospholipase L1-like esterase